MTALRHLSILVLLAGSVALDEPVRAEPAASDEARAGNPLVATRTVETESVSLTPAAADELRRKVLRQCGLSESTSGSLPWYFHFEFGRALLGSGDPRRAVVELSRAVELNPVPKAGKRMYGMWYIDYFPYYQLALAQAELGNWSCAANAMRLSKMTENAASGHFDMVKYSALRRQIEGKAPYTEACHPGDEPTLN